MGYWATTLTQIDGRVRHGGRQRRCMVGRNKEPVQPGPTFSDTADILANSEYEATCGESRWNI
jgi:hypothetical protein